jgi:ATP-dependent Lon protease
MAEDNPGPDDLCQGGVVATIIKMLKLPDRRVKILIQALTKARIIDFT